MSIPNKNSSIAQNLLDDYNYHQEMNEEDSIDFGDGIAQDKIVAMQKSNDAVPVPTGEERTCTDIPLDHIEHKDGGTLMLDAAAIQEYEEEQKLENETNNSGVTDSHSNIIMLIVALFAIAGVLSLVLWVNKAEDPAPAQDQEQTADNTHKQKVHQALVTTDTPISIKPKNSNLIINGVFFDILDSHAAAGNYPLLTDYDNVIAVYADNHVPYITRLERSHDYIENPVNIELLPDEFYQHSDVIIKVPSNVDPQNMQLIVNGQPIQPVLKEQRITCLSGFPYFIQVNAKDKGSHLHVFWPTHTEETVQLPDLELKSNADVVTLLTLKLPKNYESDSSLNVRITAEDQTYHSAGVMRIGKGEFIDVSIQKSGRYPMELAFDSTPFGSIYIDGYLQPSSKGVAQVHFSNKSDRNVKLCFRRASETICTVDAMTYVSSGKWELLAYREEKDGSRTIFKEQPYEVLKADHDYLFTVSAGKTNFTYKIVDKPIK